MKKIKLEKNQGFTLLEGILVASLIGIAASVVRPNF